MAEEKNEKAGVFALICSFLFPLVGIICYFVNKKTLRMPHLIYGPHWEDLQ